MTHYVQIVRNGEDFRADDWTPWKNCDGAPQDTALLAVGKMMREGGYTMPRAEWEPFAVMIYVATDKTPRHPNGRFMWCDGFKMELKPTAKDGVA